MFAILRSALNGLLGFVFTRGTLKWAAFAIVAALLAGLLGLLRGWLPNPTDVYSSLSGLSSGFWYFADLLGFSAGLPLVMAAHVTRFVIRRLPIVG